MKDSLGWNATQSGLISSVVGVIDILVQGVLMGKLSPIFGDIKLGIGSLILVMVSYVLLGAIAVVAAIILFAGSGGLVENALRGLTSQMVGPRQQGVVAGASQSMQSLAMILGPLFGGLLYVQLGHAIPYWTGALIIGLAIPGLRRHAEATRA